MFKWATSLVWWRWWVSFSLSKQISAKKKNRSALDLSKNVNYSFFMIICPVFFQSCLKKYLYRLQKLITSSQNNNWSNFIRWMHMWLPLTPPAHDCACVSHAGLRSSFSCIEKPCPLGGAAGSRGKGSRVGAKIILIKISYKSLVNPFTFHNSCAVLAVLISIHNYFCLLKYKPKIQMFFCVFVLFINKNLFLKLPQTTVITPLPSFPSIFIPVFVAFSISEPFQPVSPLKKWLLGCCSSTETIPDRAASQGQLGVPMKLQDAVKAHLMAASDIYLFRCNI